jgi:lamin tail-like protein
MQLRATRRSTTVAGLVAAAVGFASVGLAAPAAAAAAPTISAPASRVGYGPITISGTAPAGATVTLIEAAYLFRGDMNPAVDYDTGDVVTAVANGAGHYAISRLLDSGFVFAVEAGGARSATITVAMRVLPALTLSTSGSGVYVNVQADPGQPGLPVQIQRYTAAGTWTTLVGGDTVTDGAYSTELTGQGAGSTQSYRAHVGADPTNAILTNDSATLKCVIGTSCVVTATPTAPTKPTTPAPAAAKAGDVLFTRAQYNSPGADTGSNASLNGEWVRLTNKTKKTINLKGWTVRDRSAHIYTFGTAYNLGAGASVYLRTGKGTNGKPVASYRFWGKTGYIWNNTGDAATLRSPANKNIDSCSWGAGSGVTAC